MPIKCPQCGSICRDNARFCDTCGTGLSVLSTGGGAPAAPADRPPSSASAKSQPRLPSNGCFTRAGKWAAGILLWAGAALTTAFSGFAFGAFIRIDSEKEMALELSAIAFVAAAVLVFLLSRLSPRTWFRYFAAVFAVMVIGTLFDPDSHVPLDAYPFIVCGIALPVGLFFLRRGKPVGPKGVIWGRVTDVQPRHQASGGGKPNAPPLEVLEFRLQETSSDFREILRDEEQNPLPAYAVEVRAKEIRGLVQNGDKVMLEGFIANGIIFPKRVTNYTTQSELSIVDPN